MQQLERDVCLSWKQVLLKKASAYPGKPQQQ